MIISREYIPFKILKQIKDPAYLIFRDAYASCMGKKEADKLMENFIDRNEALCDREMGWCIPDANTTIQKMLDLDFVKPLYTETLPYFPVPEEAESFHPEKENRIILFFHENEEYGCFSQWYQSPFIVEGIQYLTAEQYMMSRKALLFHDYEILGRILNQKDPHECKMLGKQVRGFKGYIWDEHKEDIVYRANLAKFSQNYEIQEILLKTGTATLAEASPYDRIWGIGRHADDPKAKDPALWKGENLLGQTLMHVREELALQMQILEVAESGIHAAMDFSPRKYYVSPYQKKEMDKLLKMITGATSWLDGDILTHTSFDDEILEADGYPC